MKRLAFFVIKELGYVVFNCEILKYIITRKEEIMGRVAQKPAARTIVLATPVKPLYDIQIFSHNQLEYNQELNE